MSLFPIQAVNKDFSKLNKLIYGFPKTGKSTFAAQMSNDEGLPPAFITTEEGLGAIPDVSLLRVTSWEGFLRLVNTIKAQADELKKQHSCFVIDLISDLDEMCAIHICTANKIKYLGDLEHGKGWFMHKTNFRAAVNDLFSVLPVSFICHSSEREVMWNNEKIKIQAPLLAKSCLEYVNGKVDLIMWISPANNKKEYPEIVMQNSTTCIAGSRYPQLVRSFPMDPKSMRATYLNIQKTFADGFSVPTNSGENK